MTRAITFPETLRWVLLSGTLGVAMAACGGGEHAPRSADVPAVTPAYNAQTGRLEQLAADRSGDGKIDTWAFMDGVRLQRIEIDRDGDGRPDRWEHYEEVPAADARAAESPVRLVRVEESSGSDGAISRREFYEAGVLQRVEEDTNLTGRASKWEYYSQGALARVDLDLAGRGTPDQRLFYGPTGDVQRVERDADGDGRFEPVATPSAP
jgi:hypothetical protein